ncbi:XRCC1 protein, partial [Chordeiles acutipennis]|nr:XRCC1 protein [Chordeiles acutipennis]
GSWRVTQPLCRGAQDPRYPAENLLREDGLRPWLSCPQDRSRQLRVELQLERAIPIGYVDVGNCGCAFLQIEVGRSSWPLDRPYLTLVPSVTLMTPADSKLDRNRCAVRMFKEGTGWSDPEGKSPRGWGGGRGRGQQGWRPSCSLH